MLVHNGGSRSIIPASTLVCPCTPIDPLRRVGHVQAPDGTEVVEPASHPDQGLGAITALPPLNTKSGSARIMILINASIGKAIRVGREPRSSSSRRTEAATAGPQVPIASGNRRRIRRLRSMGSNR